MSAGYQIGDRVEVYLDEKFGERQGWHAGTVFKLEPYSEHRSFYWVRFDADVQTRLGMAQLSVFNPKNMRMLTHS